MTEINQFNITFNKLTKKEYDTYLKKFVSKELKEFRLDDSNFIINITYILNDQRIINDYSGIVYVFKNMNDFMIYKYNMDSIMDNLTAKYEKFKNPEKFFDSYSDYIVKLETDYGKGFRELDVLTKIDKAISIAPNREAFINNNYYLLTALIGEFYLNKYKGSHWVNYNLGNDSGYPVIQADSEVFSPVDILESILYRNKTLIEQIN